MQVWGKEGLILRPGLSLAQRICYFTSVVTYFEGWQKAILYFTPMVVLTAGVMPILWTGDKFIELFLLWLISGMLVNETVGRGYTKTLWMEEYNCLRYFTFINATLALFLPIKWRFRVTPKDLTTIGKLPIKFLPQALIIVFATMAVIIGAHRFLSEQYLPLGAFVANIVWAGVNAVIAARAIGFSLGKSRQRRGGHRFAIPVPVVVNHAGSPIRLIADDLSAGGMCLHVPPDINAPDAVKGRILLPNGPLQFSARVVRRNVEKTSGRRIIHVQFDWERGVSPDRLNACLYGNALQWAANDWRETSPLDFTWRHMRLWLQRNRKRAPEEEWQFSELRSSGGDVLRCLTQKSRSERNTWRALSYERPSSVNALMLRTPALTAAARGLHISGSQVFRIDPGTVFVMVLKREENMETAIQPTSSVPLAAGENA
jgi:cellulose synthase (UDP-forming)